MELSASALATAAGGTILGDASRCITGAGAIDKAGPNDLAFIVDGQNLKKLATSNVGVVLIKASLKDDLPTGELPCTVILADDPLAIFLEALDQLRPAKLTSQQGISPHAHIDPSSKIGDGTTIYPNVFIDREVTIGRNCTIHAGCSLGPGSTIGDNVTLFANTVFYDNTIVGNNVIIHASVVLGSDGFGYRFENGHYKKLPHHGCVRIEDDVEIGAGTTIDRAMIGETIVGKGTKIDNQVMIAHNCEIGEDSAFASQVGIAGSTTIGSRVRIGGQVGIADHLQIGDDVAVGAKSGLHRDIPDGEVHVGYPAGPIDEQRRIAMAQQRLPELRKQVRQIGKAVQQLEQQTQSKPDSDQPDLKVA